jgi:2-polyprenyl-3-methyl-5-hydroxy-6-metoxy-1,4-benzoquinol methylase
VLEQYGQFRRVSSDCKPLPPGGPFGICDACGGIQTFPTKQWQNEVDSIYADYSPYFQAGGVEQAVFNPQTGEPRTRSAALVGKLEGILPSKGKGCLLDVGCGNGAFLKAFGHRNPGWQMVGYDLGAHHRETVLGIPGVEAFHGGALEDVEGQFDLVSMIHVLEHIPSPRDFLQKLLPLLAPGGRLLVQVPNWTCNPFILLVADHCSHFCARALVEQTNGLTLAVEKITGGLIPKEWTLLCRLSDAGSPSVPVPGTGLVSDTLGRIAEFLGKVRKETDGKSFSIFGTSLAGIWLADSLGWNNVSFIDEDPARVGSQLNGKPITPASGLPDGCLLVVPLPNPICRKVAQRIQVLHPHVKCVLPSEDFNPSIPAC